MSPLISRKLTGRRGLTEAGGAAPAPLQADLRVGTTLAGYRVDELVGRGGMGVVYRAQQMNLQRTVALKLLGPELAQGESFRERFIRESQIAAGILHPNVVTVYDAGEAEGLLWIAMQYVDGTDLASELCAHGSLEPDVALPILEQVAGALDAAHAGGLVHRDVKPANVLLDSTRAYLTDFGLTRRTSAQVSLTAVGQFVGTIDYMPPEQIAGGALDGRADVYALGCLLYHLLAGRPPFEKESQVAMIYAHLQEQPEPLSSMRDGLPHALDAVVGRALAKRPEDRYDSATELISALRRGLGAEPPRSADVAARESRPVATVIVADDEPGFRALISMSLEDARLTVIEAEDGDEALALARRHLPELVFVDWSLRGTPGREICTALRADPRTTGIRVVALVSRADRLDGAALVAAGADDWLRKPFSSLQVLYKVAQLLGPDVATV